MNPMDMNYLPLAIQLYRFMTPNSIANTDTTSLIISSLPSSDAFSKQDQLFLLLCGLALPVRVSIEIYILHLLSFQCWGVFLLSKAPTVSMPRI